MGGHHVLRDGCTLFLQFYIFYIAYHSKYDLADSPIPCPWGVKLFPVFFHREEPGRIQGFPSLLPFHFWSCHLDVSVPKNPNFSSFTLLSVPEGASFL